MLLTSRIVRAARPRERRYVLADEDEHSMSLHVMPRGSKWWRFRYRFQHAERMISLGVYPGVNLATARLLHADARGLLARDIDPSADRKEKCAASAHTFEVVARQWLKLLQPRVANGQLAADTVEDATRILERDIFRALGTRSIWSALQRKSIAYDLPAFTTYDAALGVGKNAWLVQVYAENLTDTRAELYGNYAQWYQAITVSRPRTIGLRFSYKFGSS